MDTTQQQFDAAYWASQPPEIQALQSIADPDQRADQAAELATNGFTIDVPIMVWGWDAYLVMTLRAQFGYTWVPSALQPPVTIAPGVAQPGVVAYNPSDPPPGSIMVSTNIADYPPFTPPPQPTPQTPQGATRSVCNPSATSIFRSRAKRIRTAPRSPIAAARFRNTSVVTPFGRNAYWEKIA